MPYTKQKPGLDVTISVRWEGGDRKFDMALTHEAIISSSTGDTILANAVQKKIKVPFLYWQRLEVQLSHIWISGQGQVIYSKVSDQDHRKAQEQVIELLSMWQQHACVDPRSMRMMITLDIDTAGVHLLPSREKLLSLTHGVPKEPADARSSASSPEGTLKARVSVDNESDDIFKTIEYDSPKGLDSHDSSDDSPILDTHVTFDRSERVWNRIVFSRTSSTQT
jgi:hypothetical protein